MVVMFAKYSVEYILMSFIVWSQFIRLYPYGSRILVATTCTTPPGMDPSSNLKGLSL